MEVEEGTTKEPSKVGMPNELVRPFVHRRSSFMQAMDKALQLSRHAEYASAHIPGVRLVSFDRGSHLLFMVEQSAIREEVRRFILTHANGSV
jgi:hypothetical protein